MTANQSAPGAQATRNPATLHALRRGARALKRIHDEQVLMWEGFVKASRFPVDHQ